MLQSVEGEEGGQNGSRGGIGRSVRPCVLGPPDKIEGGCLPQDATAATKEGGGGSTDYSGKIEKTVWRTLLVENQGTSSVEKSFPRVAFRFFSSKPAQQSGWTRLKQYTSIETLITSKARLAERRNLKYSVN